MKVSFDWLSQYVDLSDISPELLAEKLTMGAFEVEEITVYGADLVGPIVVGEIMEIHPHPNADKIRLTKTRIKKGEEPLDIVCGAQNIEVGQIIPVALPGAKVVNRHDGTPLHIKASAIRGVKSNGMLCSAPELGLVPDPTVGDGILILGNAAQNGAAPELGQDATKVLNIKPDYILHVEPRSNRGDALSVKGLAREVAALFGRPLKSPEWSLDTLGSGTCELAVNSTFIEDVADCPYFSLIPISGIKIGPSHPDIVKRLEAIGVRPVNNVVDITNYVMHELGQPLHAYDGQFAQGPKLGVRRAKAGEKLTTLDGKERDLNEETLIIVDSEKPVGMAGIMGGKDSEINDNSTSLLLEAACFTPNVVRRGSRTLGLSSDASLRFERGVDAASVLNASKRAAYLIGKYCASADLKIGKPIIAGSDAVKTIRINLRKSAIKRILALDLATSKIKALLSPLGFEVTGGDEAIVVSVPSFRQEDVKREIDLVEEVCRLNGYDAIAATMPTSTACGETADDTRARVQNTLSILGLSEAWLSSLVPETEVGINKEYLVEVLNPLSKDHKLLRQSLIPGLVNSLVYNQDRGQKAVWLYELGRVYHKNNIEPGSERGQTGVVEAERIGAVISGNTLKKLGESQPIDFGTARGLVENLLSSLGINASSQKLTWQSKHDNLYPWMHPYRTAVLTLNRPPKKGTDLSDTMGVFGNPMVLGYVSQVHPAFADSRSLNNEAFVFELDLDRLKAERKAPKFVELAQTPVINRDLTVDFDVSTKAVEQQTVERLISAKGGNYLKAIDLVSIYQSQSTSNKISLTYRLTFQNPSETLINEEVDKVLLTIRESLEKDLAASFRL